MRSFTSGWRRAARPLVAMAVIAIATAWAASVMAADVPPAAMNEAKQIFSTRCSPCHGAQGKGDGAASAGLTPKPRNFGDPEWQKSVTDEHIAKIIKLGGPAVGKSPLMPGNPDLASKDDVVKGLVTTIRGLAAKN